MEQGVGHWDFSLYTRDKDFLFSSFFVIFFMMIKRSTMTSTSEKCKLMKMKPKQTVKCGFFEMTLRVFLMELFLVAMV